MYFSGFCLENEKDLFSEYLIENDFTVSGFSYGAIKAVEYVLNTKNRVDTLQLFSPSYFNDKNIKYKRMQLMYFKKDAATYSNNFLNNCGMDSKQQSKYFNLGLYEQLDELLNYNWCEEKIKSVIKKGTIIEIYLGVNDKIINSKEASEFFRRFGDVYYIKEKGHIL